MWREWKRGGGCGEGAGGNRCEGGWEVGHESWWAEFRRSVLIVSH